MIDAHFFLDLRRLDKESRGHMYIRFSKYGKSALIGTGIHLREDQWDGHEVINHEDKKLLNSLLDTKIALVNRTIIEKTLVGEIAGKSVKEVKEILETAIDPDLARKKEEHRRQEENSRKSFLAYFAQFMDEKKNKGTRQLYHDTYIKVESFCKKRKETTLFFDDISKEWLFDFEAFCRLTQKQNTTSRHLRDIRAVFNAAIDDGLTNNYPFRKFKIKQVESVDKSYSAEELRALFNHPCYPRGEKEAVEMFKLMFCLIGINCGDLANAEKPIRGRLEYNRAKTGKHYSIKIEPEAARIIKEYAGETLLLYIGEKYSYKTYFNRMGKTLRKVGKVRNNGKRSSGKAILPEVCTGSARTSWATIAQQELDIPRDVIAAALGHHTVDVTSTYLRTDWKKKVDAANRKVLDWVLYGKKTP